MSATLLRGLRVLDVTTPLAYTAGVLLASLGAEVIRIDRAAGERSAAWRLGNRGKHCIAIDYETAAGRAQLLRLATDSDVMIESFKPGRLAAIGLGFDVLEGINPRLSLISITPFGQTGPNAAWEAGELVTAAMSGIMSVQGLPGREPLKEPLDAHFFHACMAGAMGAMIANHHQRRAGQGQWVDISAQELGASRNTIWTMAHQFDHRGLTRCGDQLNLGRGPTRLIWRIKDGYATAALANVPTPVAAAVAEWMEAEGYANPLRGREIRSPADMTPELSHAWAAAIADFLKDRTRAELMTEGLRRGANVIPLNAPHQVAADAQFTARNFFGTVDGPDDRPWQLPRWFLRVEGEPAETLRVPGQSGEVPMPTGPPAVPIAPQAVAPGPGVAALPLSGVKVLDFSWAIIGNTATKMMADLGATVVKVESHRRLSIERINMPLLNVPATGAPNNSPWFANIATSKLSLKLNLSHPESRGVLDELLQWCDIVFENFSPGVMDRLGLGYETLRDRKPDVIMVSASIFGQSGPLGHLPGTDATGAAHCGRMAMSGYSDGGPTLPSATFGDSVTPFPIVTAMLAALRRRETTGRGCRIDASMAEVLTHQMLPDIVQAQADGQSPSRRGNRQDDAAPHNAFPAAGDDAWIAISVFNDSQWQALCEVLQQPQLATDARFATLAARKLHEDVLETAIATLTREYDRHALAAQLQAAGVPAGPVQTAADIVEHDPQIKARAHLQLVDHPVLGPFFHQRTPLTFSRTPGRMLPAPMLGEHTRQICRELLGMDPARYQQLDAAGVFE